MAVLLFRIQAPLQSWGISSNFTIRDTTKEPSKSGVIGLICAALGRPRDADLSDLADLKMGVRVDREGVLQKDYQIAQDVLKAKGKKTKNSEPSTRYYLADAVFLVGLQGQHALLKEIHQALKNPHWAVYFGRKAFVPALPLWLEDGLKSSDDLVNELRLYPCLVSPPPDNHRLIIEDAEGELTRADVPLSFKQRSFSSRRVRVFYTLSPSEMPEV